MKKKFLALVLTLAMVLSLAPVGALATNGGESQTPEDVIYDNAAHKGNATVDGVDSLNKTAVKAEGENTYNVTLEVKMYETTSTISQAAATVLVIDISNSMGCTKTEHKHTDECYETEKIKCTAKSNPEHWVVEKGILGEYPRHKDERDNFQSECKYDYLHLGYYYDGETKLTCGKEEHSYNDNCHTRLTDAKDAARAFVETYAGSVPNAGRNLAIVLFNRGASVVLNWTDASTNKVEVLSAIDNISLGDKSAGSTNLEQGLSKAGDLLGNSSLNDISKDNKNIIALTDGAPTHYGAKPYGNGSSGSETINYETAKTAKELKKVANLYTVCFGAEDTNTYRGGPTVGKFLRESIATDSNHAYNADNADQLNEVFEKLSQTITSGLSAGTVHDALPDGVSSSAFGNSTEADWNLSVEGGFTCDKDVNAETGRTGYTYTKTYTVTIDPERINPGLLDENDYYPLNGQTTLKVTVNNEEQELNFPIPYGKVKFNTYSVTYKDGAEGTVFTDSTTDNLRKGANIPAYENEDSIHRDGYTFSGWKWYQGETALNEKPSAMPAADLVAVAQWTANTYTVTWKDWNGTELKKVEEVAYGTTASDVAEKAPADPSRASSAQYDYTFTGWDKEYADVTGDQVYTAQYKEAAKENPPEPVANLNYKIIQHFRDAKGNEIENLRVDSPKTITAADAEKITSLNTLVEKEGMAKNMTDASSNNYVYVPNETTFKADGKDVTTLIEGTQIDLYYYLDNWKDGDSKTPTEDDSATGGDGIPDCYQVLVNYKSGDTNRGSVGPLTMEVLTIKSNSVYASEGQVTASGSTATATGNRCYFSNWTNDTNDANVNTSNESAKLGQQTFTANGGETYTFTANFGRSSGGSNRPKPPVVEIPDDVPTGLNGKDHYAYVVGYPDGMVYPQKNITRAEVATIFFRLLKDETREANMTKSNSYNDMKDGAWYTCAVSTLSKMGIIKGYEDGSFKPDASISRAEFAAIAARFDPDGDKTPATFSDVSSHWAKDEISIAANHGWIKGYEDGSFKPDQKITRAETMTLVNRVLKRLPETKDDLHKDMKTWPDNQNESAWFYLAVQEATNSHYQKLKKDGTHETWESMRETRDWAALEK